MCCSLIYLQCYMLSESVRHLNYNLYRILIEILKLSVRPIICAAHCCTADFLYWHLEKKYSPRTHQHLQNLCQLPLEKSPKYETQSIFLREIYTKSRHGRVYHGWGASTTTNFLALISSELLLNLRKNF